MSDERESPVWLESAVRILHQEFRKHVEEWCKPCSQGDACEDGRKLQELLMAAGEDLSWLPQQRA